MKIKSIRKVKLDNPEPVYEIYNAIPNHNFLIRTKSGCIVSHNCGVMDEVNFSKGQSEDITQSYVMKTYRTVKRRMESRYMRNGEIPGILFMVSSKKSEYDFLEQYVQSQKNNPNVYIIDEPVWNIKPQSTYCGKRFHVAIGNKYVKSRVMKDEESISDVEKQGYRVIDVPIEYRNAFETDLDASLMDIANVPSTSKAKYISYDRLKRNYNPSRKNPFKTEILTIGLDDSLEISDFFTLSMVDEYTKSRQGFVHIDTSLKGDKTGISYVINSGEKSVQKYRRTDDGIKVENATDLVFRQVFSVAIKAPSDSEISFEKTRKFLYYLRNNGFNIQRVSTDGFQSADTRQLLLSAGFDTKLISLDRSPAGYEAFRSAVNEERLDLFDLDNTLLEKEIIELEKDAISGKVDHPMTGCLLGETEIMTQNGPKRLMDLDEHTDKVYAVDKNKNIVLTNFTNLRMTRKAEKIYSIVSEDYRVVGATGNHPFLTPKGYVPAEELTKGSKLLVKDKDSDKVIEVGISGIFKTVRHAGIPVYDIEVPIYSNFILANGLIVHNSKDIADSLCGAIYNAMTCQDLIINNRYTEVDTNLAADLLSDNRAYDINKDIFGGITPANNALFDNDDDIIF